MKRNNLFKVLAITLLITFLISLVVPGSYVDYYGNVTSSGIAGLGLFGLFSNFSISIAYFNSVAVYVIAIVCLYTVLNKVESYNSFVDSVASLFKNRKGLLICLTAIIFAILSMVVSDFMILLVFVPFIYKVMNKMEIDNKTILASTIIALIIGNMCNIYNSSLFSTFSINVSTLLLVKIIVLIVSLFALLIIIAPKKKANKKVAKEETKKEVKKVETKKVSSNKETTKKTDAKKVAPKKASSKKTTAKKTVAKKTTKKTGKKVA